MRKRTTITLLTVAAACLVPVAAAVAASWISVYSNAQDTLGKRSQMVLLGGPNCIRGGSAKAFRIEIGKKTSECAYRTPVVGRDVEIEATGRLLSGTPRKERKRTFLALNLRSGGGGRYQLAVWPMQKKYQLRKFNTDGSEDFLAIGKRIGRIHPINKANVMRLRALNLQNTSDPDDCRLFVFIGDKLLSHVLDNSCGPLTGRYATISMGAGRSDRGAVGSFADLSVRVPNPF